MKSITMKKKNVTCEEYHDIKYQYSCVINAFMRIYYHVMLAIIIKKKKHKID